MAKAIHFTRYARQKFLDPARVGFPGMSLKMRYDREDDVLMVWFAEGKQVDHAEQSGQSILHVTEKGEPVLLEILRA